LKFGKLVGVLIDVVTDCLVFIDKYDENSVLNTKKRRFKFFLGRSFYFLISESNGILFVMDRPKVTSSAYSNSSPTAKKNAN
jgi:hypothetical protein